MPCRLEKQFDARAIFSYSVEELDKEILFEYAVEEVKQAPPWCGIQHEIPSPSTIDYLYIEKEVVGRIQAKTFSSEAVELLSIIETEYLYKEIFRACNKLYDALYILFMEC